MSESQDFTDCKFPDNGPGPSHAYQKMRRRNIPPAAIKKVLREGEPTGNGYNGRVELKARWGGRPIVVVVDPDTKEIVTVSSAGDN